MGTIGQYFQKTGATRGIRELPRYARDVLDKTGSYVGRIKNISPDTEALIGETVGVCLPVVTPFLTVLIFRDSLSFEHLYGCVAVTAAEFAAGMKLELHSQKRRAKNR